MAVVRTSSQVNELLFTDTTPSSDLKPAKPAGSDTNAAHQDWRDHFLRRESYQGWRRCYIRLSYITIDPGVGRKPASERTQDF